MDNYYGNICYCRRCNGVVHTIKKGDTLYLISKYYKVPIGEIMNANRNINIYNLQIGDEICIPVRRPEPREGEPAQRLIPYMTGNMNNTGGMNRNMEEINNENDMNDMRNMDSMSVDNINGMDSIDKENDMSVTSSDIAESSFDENIKLSELLNRENITLGEFMKLMRKFDREQ